MNRPLIELADSLQDWYGVTREWRDRERAILRAADAVIEAADSYCMYATPQKRNELLDAVVAYEAACRQGKEHE